MKTVCAFTFPKDTSREVIEDAMASAIFNAECIFGKPKVKVSGIVYHLSEDGAQCVVDVSSEVGEHVAQVFAGIVMNRLGEDRFQVRRFKETAKGLNRTLKTARTLRAV
jgi:hypothetical protein